MFVKSEAPNLEGTALTGGRKRNLRDLKLARIMYKRTANNSGGMTLFFLMRVAQLHVIL